MNWMFFGGGFSVIYLIRDIIPREDSICTIGRGDD